MRKTLLTAAVFWLTAGEYAVACDTPTYATDIQDALRSAEAHFSVFEIPEFESELDRAFAGVECLKEPIEIHLAAELHRFGGIRAFGEDDLDLARRSFAAARALEPAYNFPSTLFPKDHPILVEYSALNPVDASEPVPRLADGRFTLDGSPSSTRPIDRPAVVQWIGADGGIRVSKYVLPGSPLPEAPRYTGVTVEPKRDPVVDAPPIAKRNQKRRWIAVASSGALLATAGLTYGAALLNKQGFNKVDADLYEPDNFKQYKDELTKYQRRANALTVVSLVTGVGAVGVGVTAVFVAEF